MAGFTWRWNDKIRMCSNISYTTTLQEYILQLYRISCKQWIETAFWCSSVSLHIKNTYPNKQYMQEQNNKDHFMASYSSVARLKAGCGTDIHHPATMPPKLCKHHSHSLYTPFINLSFRTWTYQVYNLCSQFSSQNWCCNIRYYISLTKKFSMKQRKYCITQTAFW